MTITVKVLLNQTGGFLSYAPGDELHEVLVFEHPTLATWGRLDVLLETIWQQLNVDHPDAEWAKEYRAKRNRSLSMGDVVVIGESAWSPLVAGWERVTL